MNTVCALRDLVCGVGSGSWGWNYCRALGVM